MSEQTPNETEARAELSRACYQQIVPALHSFCAGCGPLMTSYDGAVVIVGASAALLAAFGGPELAAAMLRGLADQLAAPIGATMN